tara:strand:+ start:329 stop:1006 length:678 start_codon:yes stop_codon:yes gene_type:complete
MKYKKQLLILSIVISVLQLIYLFLLHIEVVRYYKLKYNLIDFKKSIDNYKNLPKNNNYKTIISFTTYNSDLNKIKPMIHSILNQTQSVDKIILNIPYDKEYNIPNDFKKILYIYKNGKDFGKGNSFIPTLTREEEKNTKIIFVKDNTIYSEYFVEDIINTSEKFPNNPISCNKNYLNDENGFLVCPSFYKSNVVNYKKKKIDNLWMNKYLKKKKIKQIYSRNYSY